MEAGWRAVSVILQASRIRGDQGIHVRCVYRLLDDVARIHLMRFQRRIDVGINRLDLRREVSSVQWVAAHVPAHATRDEQIVAGQHRLRVADAFLQIPAVIGSS